MLEHFSMQDCLPVETPMDAAKLDTYCVTPAERITHLQVVGTLD
jgi:hypothetical protein